MHAGYRSARTPLFEAVVQSVAEARAAEAAGVDRLELCVHLADGGLTPPPELTRAVVAAVRIPVHAMVRARPGPFTADPTELAALERHCAEQRAAGARGLVFGVLDDRSTVDVAATARLVRAARPCVVTFHRAFDGVPDQSAALETLIGLGIERVLTSGGAANAYLGCDALRTLVEQAAGRIVVMAGGGVRHTNWRAIVAATGVRELHGSVPIRTRGQG